jgi:hypothetical protein
MMKKFVRLLALTLTLALAAAAVAVGETCTRETGWRDAAGNALDCYTCGSGSSQVTYCYPAQ